MRSFWKISDVSSLPRASKDGLSKTSRSRVVHEFPGGHMFYTREASRIALRKDVMEMFSTH
jgi:hypothetical protein